MELYADKLCFVVYSPAIVLQTLLQNGKQTTTKKPVVNKRRQCESIRFAKVKEKKIERLRLSQGTKNSVSTPRLLKNRIKRGKGEKKKKEKTTFVSKGQKKKRFRISAIVKCVSPTFPYHEKTEKKASYKLSKQKKKKKGGQALRCFFFFAFSFLLLTKTRLEKRKKNEREYETRIGVAEKSSNVLVFYVLLTQKKKEAKQQKKKGFQSRRGLAIITQ